MVLSVSVHLGLRLAAAFLVSFSAWLISYKASAQDKAPIPTLTAELRRASAHNQLGRMSMALRDGANVNSGALVAAAKAGHLEAVTYLLEQPGVDVNLGEGAHSALDYAVLQKNPAMVKVLVAKGSVINRRSTFREFQTTGFDPEGPPSFLSEGSPLFVALLLNCDELAVHLLSAGADPHLQAIWYNFRKDNSRERPLELAARLKNSAMVQLLLEYGAEPNDDKLVREVIAKMMRERERRHLGEALNLSIGDAKDAPDSEIPHVIAPLRDIIVDYAREVDEQDADFR